MLVRYLQVVTNAATMPSVELDKASFEGEGFGPASLLKELLAQSNGDALER